MCDSGVGIPSDRQQEIFEAFAQGERPATRGAGGTGLGLTICRQLLALMNGRIDVTSTEGDGSTFAFTVPIEIEDQAPPLGVPAAATAAPTASRALRVLVADDHPASRRLMNALLTRAGHRVNVVADGRQAVRALDRERFDLVLMDGQMPGMDGLDATRAIRRREQARAKGAVPRRTPIVALTATAMTGDRERFLAAGFDAYVSKPVDGAELLCLVEAIVPPATRPDGAPPPAIDMRRLLTLVRNDRELVRRLVDDVVHSCPSDLAELRAAVTDDDAPRVSRVCHRVQGALAVIAAGPAARALARVAVLVRAGAADAAQAAFAEFERRLDEMPRALDA